MTRTRVPLFPLEVVLFPEMPLPLHIFEPRYKLMIGGCLEGNKTFGVVQAKSSGIAAVGCTAEIAKVIRRYPDGKMDLLTVGRAPFQILEVVDERPYLECVAVLLRDEDEPLGEGDRAELTALYDECHTLIFGRVSEIPATLAVALTYLVAGELPFDPEFKQRLLETRSEHQRFELLLRRLKEWLPQLSHRDRVRRRAGGNGHALV